jgi:DNA ligase (NAD+)
MIKIETDDIAKTDTPKGTEFAGMIAVFTGVRNADMEKRIVDGGGNIGSSVSGKTTVVIAKDPSENSSKLNKAREMGIEVIGVADFEKKYLSK